MQEWRSFPAVAFGRSAYTLLPPLAHKGPASQTRTRQTVLAHTSARHCLFWLALPPATCSESFIGTVLHGWLVVIVQDLERHSSRCTFVSSSNTQFIHSAAVFCICWVHSQMLVFSVLSLWAVLKKETLLLVANIRVVLWQNDVNVEVVTISPDWSWASEECNYQRYWQVFTWAEGRPQLLHVPLSFPSYRLCLFYFIGADKLISREEKWLMDLLSVPSPFPLDAHSEGVYTIAKPVVR